MLKNELAMWLLFNNTPYTTLIFSLFIHVSHCTNTILHQTDWQTAITVHAWCIKCIYSPLFKTTGQPLIRAKVRGVDADALCLCIKSVWLECRFVPLLRHFRTPSRSGTLPVSIIIRQGVLDIYWSINLKHSPLPQVPATYCIVLKLRTDF